MTTENNWQEVLTEDEKEYIDEFLSWQANRLMCHITSRLARKIKELEASLAGSRNNVQTALNQIDELEAQVESLMGNVNDELIDQQQAMQERIKELEDELAFHKRNPKEVIKENVKLAEKNMTLKDQLKGYQQFVVAYNELKAENERLKGKLEELKESALAWKAKADSRADQISRLQSEIFKVRRDLIQRKEILQEEITDEEYDILEGAHDDKN